MDEYGEGSGSGRSTPNPKPYSGGLTSKYASDIHGGDDSGRSSPVMRIQPGAFVHSRYGALDPDSSYNSRILSGAYNPTPVASINAMPYPFSSMKTPQRLLIPSSTVLETTRPFVCRTPRSSQAVNYDLEAVSDDEDSTYVAAGYKLPPSRKVCNYIDDIVNSPEMDQVEEETKKIRRDAETILKRLHTPRLSGTREFNSYDYSNVYRIPQPISASAHNYATSEDYDDEERFSSLRTRPRKPLSQYLYSSSRDKSPEFSFKKVHLDTTRELQKSLYDGNKFRLPTSLSTSAIGSASSSAGYSSSSSTSVRRTPSYYPDVDTVKNNIAARARYASTRAAAAAGIRKKNEYLMT